MNHRPAVEPYPFAPLGALKVCQCCGVGYAMAARDAVICAGHLWFNCSCGSTLMVPDYFHRNKAAAQSARSVLSRVIAEAREERLYLDAEIRLAAREGHTDYVARLLRDSADLDHAIAEAARRLAELPH